MNDLTEYEALGRLSLRTLIPGLKFDREGNFTAGRENIGVPHGTRLIAAMSTLARVLTLWLDNRPVDQRVAWVRGGGSLPDRSTLGYLDENDWPRDDGGKAKGPWQKSYAILFIDPGYPADPSKAYLFSTQATGGRDALSLLSMIYRIEAPKRHKGELPIIALGGSSYLHKRYGKVRVPKFEAVDWTPEAPLEALTSMVRSEPEPEPDGSLAPTASIAARTASVKPPNAIAPKPEVVREAAGDAEEIDDDIPF
jgi:hypothetical protein